MQGGRMKVLPPFAYRGNTHGRFNHAGGVVPVSFFPMLRMLGLSAILSGVAVAQACAAPALVHSEPAAGQRVAAGNVALKLSFDTVIDPFRARLLLLGPSGVPQLLPASPIDDEQQSIATNVALTPGHYVLHWRMRARTGDPVQGTLPFDVGAPAAPVTAR
ncbi:copper resistance protein CopC [Komagataeibacter oboediens]|uniref:Copper resistance protein CopC n=1 Tax=Komagataeibacter oboediens TaxID=65958 RepID=A0ABS5SJ85_9PROT|nr:copper resistance protein CopC [Komagataeibacter oboediens]MBT0674312.1 copper resistance protein CopC [Komagataeibacter oboediens]MBT0677963.1 copper resistance protein CopC [Komagataeibacter oboediens]